MPLNESYLKRWPQIWLQWYSMKQKINIFSIIFMANSIWSMESEMMSDNISIYKNVLPANQKNTKLLLSIFFLTNSMSYYQLFLYLHYIFHNTHATLNELFCWKETDSDMVSWSSTDVFKFYAIFQAWSVLWINSFI